MIGVTILGATGTIGINTLSVLQQHPEQYTVIALTAQRNVEVLFQQCLQYQPRYAVMVEQQAAQQLQQRLQAVGSKTEVLAGAEHLSTVAQLSEVGVVMAAIVGGAGLVPTLAAAQAGKRVLLANKEALVMSGQLFMDAVHQHHAELLPIDSEHNAIFQCLPAPNLQHSPNFHLNASGVQKILLTASGGPFRNYPLDQLSTVTPEQACAHPTWNMGRKISVDSATMMNKGLEVIEACWLFAAHPEQVEVILHPQSVIHSMVAYVDGSVLAQLGNPDMRTPIAHALAYPQRISSGVKPLNLVEIAKLEFMEMDFKRFPCLTLAYQALRTGGTATTILNAANEIAVAAFLERRLKFTQIASVIEQTLAQLPVQAAASLNIILETDQLARQTATRLVTAFAS